MTALALARVSLSLMTNWKMLGSMNIPRHHPFLIVSDAKLPSDLAAIACQFPSPLHFLGSHSILSVPVMGKILEEMNVLPVTCGDNESLNFLPPLQVLRSGGSVVVLLPRPYCGDDCTELVVGVGMLAYETSVAVVPVRALHPPTAPRGRLVVRVGRPAKFGGATPDLSMRERYHSVGRRICGMLSAVPG